MKSEDLKLVVKEKYSTIARQSVLLSHQECCGTKSCCGDLGINMIGDEYNDVDGHNTDADLGLGCGIPTQFAMIKPGDSVLDLGSGAGNDCFVTRTIVGETGKVNGLDFTEAMVEKAKINLEKTGFKNIEFVQGDIEEMPFSDNSFDVVISNCVLNLVPDKNRAFSEIMRVLQPGGHFCVSDVVIKGDLPENLSKDAEMYAGCVSGALQMNEYLQIIEIQGFKNVVVHKQKEIAIPENVLANYISTEEIKNFQQDETGIYSITVSGYKSTDNTIQ